MGIFRPLCKGQLNRYLAELSRYCILAFFHRSSAAGNKTRDPESEAFRDQFDLLFLMRLRLLKLLSH